MSDERIHLSPEPTPAEAAAVQQALAALGLIEPAEPATSQDGDDSGTRPDRGQTP